MALAKAEGRNVVIEGTIRLTAPSSNYAEAFVRKLNELGQDTAVYFGQAHSYAEKVAGNQKEL